MRRHVELVAELAVPSVWVVASRVAQVGLRVTRSGCVIITLLHAVLRTTRNPSDFDATILTHLIKWFSLDACFGVIISHLLVNAIWTH